LNNLYENKIRKDVMTSRAYIYKKIKLCRQYEKYDLYKKKLKIGLSYKVVNGSKWNKNTSTKREKKG